MLVGPTAVGGGAPLEETVEDEAASLGKGRGGLG